MRSADNTNAPYTSGFSQVERSKVEVTTLQRHIAEQESKLKQVNRLLSTTAAGLKKALVVPAVMHMTTCGVVPYMHGSRLSCHGGHAMGVVQGMGTSGHERKRAGCVLYFNV